MTFGIPQIIFTAWLLVGLGIALARHGQVKTIRINAGLNLLRTAIAGALLWWGGFFTSVGVPEWIWFVTAGIGSGVAIAKHGTEQPVKIDFFTPLLGTIMALGLLWWGGFFG